MPVVKHGIWAQWIGPCLACFIGIGLLQTTGAQELYRYTASSSGPNQWALGYAVPLPRDSATPVAGFRSYAGLHMRHQDLMLQNAVMTGQVIGHTDNGREIWVYLLGDEDRVTITGARESAAMINANIHAREWQTPETSTAFIETLIDGADDQSLRQYLLENVTLIVLPVLNIDGLLQTQRYPDEVLVGPDPRAANWPRDGRMRRKNMGNVDEHLLTADDHLHGVDLNRNFPPHWSTPGVSSPDPDSLIFYGPGPISEPESQALVAASNLGPVDRLRWYVDFHSYGVITISKRTSIRRRNALQSRLLDTFRAYHGAISALSGRPRVYLDFPDSINTGAGYTVGYFADELQIPVWILEIEPSAGAGLDYGGLGAEHDGFILPDRQINRVRRDLAQAHLAVAYQQAGPPSVAAVKVIDQQLDVVVFEGQWEPYGFEQRQFRVSVNGPLVKGRNYSFWVAFDKPMRVRTDGVLSGLQGLPVALNPEVRLQGDTLDRNLPVDDGQWLDAPDGAVSFHRYKDDAFVFNARVPGNLPVADGTQLSLAIQAVDLVGQQTDANPITVIDWQSGGWQGYESDDGQNGDIGGPDTNVQLTVVDELTDWLSVDLAQSPVEGGESTVCISRSGQGEGSVAFQLFFDSDDLAEGDAVFWQSSGSFAAQQTGEQCLDVAFPDNLTVEAARNFRIRAAVVSGSAIDAVSRTYVLQDNDSESELRYVILDSTLNRNGTEVDAHSQLLGLIPKTRFVSAPVVVDLPLNGLIQPPDPVEVPAARQLYPPIRADLTIHGNGAVFARSQASANYRFFAVHRRGRLAIDNATFQGGAMPGRIGGAISSYGELLLDSVSFSHNVAADGGALWSRGEMQLREVTFQQNEAHRGAAIYNGHGTVHAEQMLASDNLASKGAIFVRGTLDLIDSTIADNVAGIAALTGPGVASLMGSQLTGNSNRNCRVVTVIDLGQNTDDDGSCGVLTTP